MYESEEVLKIKFASILWDVNVIICELRISAYVVRAKGIVTDLKPPHKQSVWGYKREIVWTMGLVACCNYLSRKKKHMLLGIIRGSSTLKDHFDLGKNKIIYKF